MRKAPRASVLGAAGVPFNGPGAETLAQSIAGRCLLAALQLHGEDYRRGRVMDWLTSCPILLRGSGSEQALQWVRHHAAGSGLGVGTVRLSPRLLASIPLR